MKKSLCVITLCGAIVSQGLYAQPTEPGTNFLGFKNFTVGASWLRWKVYEEGLSNGVLFKPSTTSFESNVTEIRPSFDTSNGYRVYAAFQTDDERWLFKISYTHLPANARRAIADDPNGLNFITASPDTFPLLAIVADLGQQFTNINSRWDMDVNYVDFDVSHNLMPENKCKIIPHLGLRTLWLNQKYRMQFNSTPDAISVNSEVKSKMAAIGVKGGLFGEYNLGAGFSVIGEFGGSLLYSKFKNTGFVTVSGIALPTVRYDNRMRKGAPTIDSNIGLNYSNHYCNYPFNIYASWENHYFFRASQFANASGNLTAQGLTLGANISF